MAHRLSLAQRALHMFVDCQSILLVQLVKCCWGDFQVQAGIFARALSRIVAGGIRFNRVGTSTLLGGQFI